MDLTEARQAGFEEGYKLALDRVAVLLRGSQHNNNDVIQKGLAAGYDEGYHNGFGDGLDRACDLVEQVRENRQ